MGASSTQGLSGLRNVAVGVLVDHDAIHPDPLIGEDTDRGVASAEKANNEIDRLRNPRILMGRPTAGPCRCEFWDVAGMQMRHDKNCQIR